MPRRSRSILPASLAAVLAVAGSAIAGPGHDPSAIPLDAGYADVDPLRTSLRFVEPTLAIDAAFERVYRVPGDPDRLYRAAGGLYAVFPLSEYVRTPAGTAAVIPAGTVFHIGPPPELLAPTTGDEIVPWTMPAIEPGPSPARRAIAAGRAQRQRLGLEDAFRAPTQVARRYRPTATISDEPIRRQRLAEIAAREIARLR